MARTVRDSRLESRTARERLAPRGKPYWRAIDPGLHLGYRKGKTGGKWVVRVYVGNESYKVETIAIADDFDDADGKRVLDYRQAQVKARERAAELAADGRRTGPYLVEHACEDYEKEVVRVKGRGDGPKETRRIIEREIKPALGSLDLNKLDATDIRAWLNAIAERPPLTRSGKPKLGVDMDDPEVQRQRKDSANRALRVLRAVLNHAYNEGRVMTDRAWRRVRAFETTTAARPEYLTVEEVKRLINAAAPDFRELVRGALHTGARPGDLKRLRVMDFTAKVGIVTFENRKAGKPYACHLTEAGVQFFARMTASKPADALIFTRENGSAWNDDDHHRPMAAAREAARLKDSVSFYTLRHTYCSHAIMEGVPMLVIAQNVGHRDTRMIEAHYGHLSPSYRADAIRAGVPDWGGDPNSEVRPMQRSAERTRGSA